MGPKRYAFDNNLEESDGGLESYKTVRKEAWHGPLCQG